MGSVPVGIDLGTTNSCIAIYKDGKVEILQDEYDSYVTPSWVSFTDDGITTGHTAKDEAHKYIKNTIFEIKRLIGQRFDDKQVQKDIKRFPYEVINDNGIPKIEVTYKQEKRTYFPEEISAFVLQKLKSLAESRLGHDFDQVVVTVPAYFNNFQRQATKDAATIAGFKKVNIINEPTAAALAFAYQNEKPYKRNVLVYDFGGGTFDVSIVTVTKGHCKVKATKGDLHLGGTDIDSNLVEFIKKDFVKQYGESIQDEYIVTRRLTNACENVKKRLSGQKRVGEIELYNLSGKDYVSSITREEFEEINADIFERTLQIVKECLTSSELTKNDIDAVVLVGGSSRIPKVQEMLNEYFGADKINKGVNPDEAVAYGAAIHANHLIGNKEEAIEDVISLPLGIANLGFLSSIIIPANTSIPAQSVQRYQTLRDNQTAAHIHVFQGESIFVWDNFELGKFTLTELRMAPAGDVKIDVCFKIDTEGILDVTASEVGANNTGSVKIDIMKKGLTTEQIQQRTEELEQNREDQRRRNDFLNAKHDLEEFCYKTASNCEKIKNDAAKSAVLSKCDEITTWLENISINDVDETELKKKALEDLYNESLLKNLEDSFQ